MKPEFSVTQHLYVDKLFLNGLLEDLKLIVQASGNDAKIMLVSAESRTINEQYNAYKGTLDRIVDALQGAGCNQAVLSICVRAYRYIPEIGFPGEMLKKLAQIGASIDVDIINMIESSDTVEEDGPKESGCN